jgi:hypothetical protein
MAPIRLGPLNRKTTSLFRSICGNVDLLHRHFTLIDQSLGRIFDASIAERGSFYRLWLAPWEGSDIDAQRA